MIGPGIAGATFEAFAEGFATGLTGVIGVTIDDGDGNNIVARTTAGIVEIETVDGFGVYRYLGTYPTPIGTYLITWDDTEVTASEEIVVSDEAVGPFDPLGLAPCEQWITAEDVADCAGIEYGSDTEEALEIAAENAVGVLFELSGRQFRGTCGPVTVRPCRTGSSCYWPGMALDRLPSCGCSRLSTVLLPGYPVREIAQVKIDGDVIAPSEYRLDGHRKLVRLADTSGDRQNWPACQRLDLEDTEETTFSVTYYYGIDPPSIAVAAASKLGAELYRACSGGECALPSGTTRVTRQGITIERQELATFLTSGSTGLPQVDAFLTAYGYGAKRRPAVWSPGGPQYAKQLG